MTNKNTDALLKGIGQFTGVVPSFVHQGAHSNQVNNKPWPSQLQARH